MKKISMVLPVYNEAEGITHFHRALTAVLDRLSEDYLFEILYVVDKSKEDSLEILKGIAGEDERVAVIGLSRRFGHQMSLVAGLDHCSGDAAIMMDTDLEHPPEVIPALLEQFEAGFDIVRTQRMYSQDVSLLKKLSSMLYYKLLNQLSEEKLSENDADFRLVSRRVIQQFKQNIREHNQYLRGLFSWVGFKQTEVTFLSEKRRYGSSHYSFKGLLTFGLQGILSFSRVPLKISILAGLVLALLGILYGGFTILQRILMPEFAPAGWVSIIAIMLVIGGGQLIVLGVIGEYIGAIYDEVKNRPLYIVEECSGKSLLVE